MTLQQEREQYRMLFGEESLQEEIAPSTLSDIDESIDEIKAMLSYAINISDQKEIKSWRRMLQQAKIQRRELLTT